MAQPLNMEKDYTDWHYFKTLLNNQDRTPTFQEREIWWCSIGLNIGHEVDGKHQYATRPVLIVRKFNPHMFLGVPLTTKVKQNPYYHHIHLKGQDQCVLLSQLRLWSGKRLRNQLGKLSQEQFNGVRNALKNML